MKMTKFKRILSFSLCVVLLAAMALVTFGCNEQNNSEQPQTEKTFTLVVTDGDGKETPFTVKTTETTVGAALLKEGLIEGDDGPYGLYIKKVNGIFAEYETTGTYWAFYVNGEYAMSGVDKTNITDGATYGLKVEK